MSADNEQSINNEAESLLDELLPDHARDLLISRVIDGRASTEDWDRFRALAANEPKIWCELAQTQQNYEMVRDELVHELSAADCVELPGGVIDDASTKRRMSLASKWGGWAIAAALLIAWSMGMPQPAEINDSLDTQTAGIPGFIGLSDADPEQALNQYMTAGQKSGRVIAEMPEQFVVETTPLPDGSIEVLYLRQIIERRVMDGAYRMIHDETGNEVPVPIRIETVINNAF
jgi:hypothetical protein